MDGIVQARAGHPGSWHHRHGDSPAAGPLMVAGLLDFNAETPVWAVSVLLIFGWAALAGTGTFRPNKAWCNRTLTQLLPEPSKAARQRRMLRRPGA